MNIYSRLEARVSAQERRQLTIDARIEELSEDVNDPTRERGGLSSALTLSPLSSLGS